MSAGSKISNLQYELLKLYSNNVSEVDLLEIKKLLASYFAQKLDSSFDEFYKEKNLSPEDLQNWANEHNRISNP